MNSVSHANSCWYAPDANGSVLIPSNETNMGTNKDFNGCITLKSLIFEEPVQIIRIPEAAFNNTIALISITIPGSIKSIASDAFNGTSGFTAIIGWNSTLGLSTGINQNFYGATNVNITQGGEPTSQPTRQPTSQPSSLPTCPSAQPSSLPSAQPSSLPTMVPSSFPSSIPTSQPSGAPSGQPTCNPTGRPTKQPSGEPSSMPSSIPTSPSSQPTSLPSGQPSGQPSSLPSGQPTTSPTASPTLPTGQPTGIPTMPTGQPTTVPSVVPSTTPTSLPSGPTPSPTPVPTIDVYTEVMTEINIAQINSMKSLEGTTITGLLENVKTDTMQATVDQVLSDRFATFHYTWLDDEQLPLGEEKFISGSCGEWNHFLSEFNTLALDFEDHYGAYLSFSHLGERGTEAVVSTCKEPKLVKEVLGNLLDMTASSSSFSGENGIYTRCPSDGDTFWIIHRCSNGVVLCVGSGSDCGVPNSCKDIEGSGDNIGSSSTTLASELTSSWLAPCLDDRRPVHPHARKLIAQTLSAGIISRVLPPKILSIDVSDVSLKHIAVDVSFSSFGSVAYCGAHVGDSNNVDTSNINPSNIVSQNWLSSINTYNTNNGKVYNATIVIKDLNPATSYQIHCVAFSTVGSSSSPVEMRKLTKYVTTTCCKKIEAQLKKRRALSGVLMENLLKITVINPPSGDLQIIPVAKTWNHIDGTIVTVPDVFYPSDIFVGSNQRLTQYFYFRSIREGYHNISIELFGDDATSFGTGVEWTQYEVQNPNVTVRVYDISNMT